MDDNNRVTQYDFMVWLFEPLFHDVFCSSAGNSGVNAASCFLVSWHERPHCSQFTNEDSCDMNLCRRFQGSSLLDQYVIKLYWQIDQLFVHDVTDAGMLR